MESDNQAIDYQAVLADLRAQRAKLDAAIAGIETMLGLAFLGNGAQSVPGQGSQVLPPDAFFGMSIVEAAKKYLAFKKKPQTTSEIAEALEKHGFVNRSENFGNTVGAGLSRNADGPSPAFAKVSRGTWGLISWYPNYRPKSDKGADEAQPEPKD